MNYSQEDTIFVQIPSYRDEQLQYTLQDLFAKAKRPENIFVGICHQYDMQYGSDSHLFEIEFPRLKQIRIKEIDYRETLGCCFARSETQKLWRGEKWNLSIDAHMRFVENWDEKCVKLLKEIQQKDEMAILSSYMPGYKINENNEITYGNNISTSKMEFEENDLPVFDGKNIFKNNSKIRQSPFIAAGFIFCKANIIEKIKYDPNLYFMGEEVSLATRMWTHGYNFYVPNFIILYHLFQEDGSGHTSFFVFNHQKNKMAIERVKNMLKIELNNDAEINRDIEKYGLGKKRRLRDYERFSGIDFRQKKQRQHTKEAMFCTWKDLYSTEKLKLIYARN
jgi:hypothetical protein